MTPIVAELKQLGFNKPRKIPKEYMQGVVDVMNAWEDIRPRYWITPTFDNSIDNFTENAHDYIKKIEDFDEKYVIPILKMKEKLIRIRPESAKKFIQNAINVIEFDDGRWLENYLRVVEAFAEGRSSGWGLNIDHFVKHATEEIERLKEVDEEIVQQVLDLSGAVGSYDLNYGSGLMTNPDRYLDRLKKDGKAGYDWFKTMSKRTDNEVDINALFIGLIKDQKDAQIVGPLISKEYLEMYNEKVADFY